MAEEAQRLEQRTRFDVEMMQDLILTALNTALEESRNMAQDRLGPLTGGLGI